MRTVNGWPRVSWSIRSNASRQISNTCIFCQHFLVTSRLAYSSSATRQSRAGTRLHEIDTTKTGWSNANSPWLQLQRRLRKARAEHQQLNTERNQETLSEEDKAVRRRDRKAAKEMRAAAAARMRQEEEDLDDVRVEQRQEIDELEDILEPQESRRERRVRRKEEEAVALRQWQASVDVALDKVQFPRPGTWDGMEMIGGETEWDTGLKFKGYLHQAKIKSRPEITAALYRSIVEVLTALSHGKNLQKIKHKPNPPAELYEDISKARISLATSEGGEGGPRELKIEYPDPQTELRIIESLEQPAALEADDNAENMHSEVEGPLAALASEEAIKEQIQAWGSDWYKIPLDNPQIKFPLIKRLTRLLGRPIPDTHIHNAKTVAQLLSAIARPERPKKLYEVLTRDMTALVGVPNVTLKPRRQTQVDRETTVGRWKLIRSELRRRGLPVLNGVTGWEMESVEALRDARREAAGLPA